METSKASGFKRLLPNLLSFVRIFGSLSLPFLMWESWEMEITLPFIEKTFSRVPVIWIIAYIILISTDKLDGTVARKLKAESELGAILDTIADALALVMGAVLCFVRFIDRLEAWQLLVYFGIVIAIVLGKVFVYILAKVYHGKGNMVHSYYHKFFAIACYPAIIIWAFMRTIPPWTIYSLFAIFIYAVIDESIYCIRTAEYNVDFKGHGFEKYGKRKK